MPIRVLDPRVVAQIAAGEVVERPASVVKELVENSLDAGATQISVEVRGGGVSFIRVMDNGFGISAPEVELAFQRHATSKISSTQDLESIATLGFRGEALPSIAAVARMEMVTRAAAEPAGTSILLEDGVVVKKEPGGCPQGTAVTVRDLFRRVPARLKFLKSGSTESSRIADVVSRYSLARPEVRFTLAMDGRVSLRTTGSGNLIDSVIEVYGIEVAQNMLEVGGRDDKWESKSDSGVRVSGLAGSPKVSRSNRDGLTFFVNRRWVSSRMLAWAVEEAYQGFLTEGKHPVAVINIFLPPQETDVNIHPAKTEIKFRNEHAVFGAVQKAVRQALTRLTPVPRIEEVATRFAPAAPVTKPRGTPSPEEIMSLFESKPATTPRQALPLLRVLGQMAGSYIVAEGPDGLYLIDQHAAHERILFDKLRAQRAAQRLEVQGLLEPVTLEVEPRQDVVLKSHFADLSRYGFDLEPFGSRTYLVRAVPALLYDGDWQAMLRETLDSLSGGDWQGKMAISMACHGAVRAGKVLSDTEMRELIEQLSQSELPHTCPHGRPTLIHLSSGQLEREFRRT
ncbi:MAG: DNA mismatch repair endonuclease MutL [Dehalococcoidia bacterium]|nr:DNA mismatch repair endonuclease MutL [Dehalococcoidia bacterium]